MEQTIYRNKYHVKTNDGIQNTLMTIYALNKKAAENIALTLLSDYGRVTLYAKAERPIK